MRNNTLEIKGIVFDKDGTLFDFESTWTPWAQQFLLHLCDQDVEQAQSIGASVGFDLKRQKFAKDSVVIAGTPEDIVDEIQKHFPNRSAAEIVEIINSEAEAAPMSETVPLGPFLTDLRKRGIALGVATNDAEAPARAHLAAVGALDHFDFIAGSDSGFGGKPAPGQLTAFCAATDLRPENIAMVGDSLHDLQAGHAAGFYRIGVLTGLAGREDLEPYADIVLDSIGQIPAWLDRI